ncbi:Sodium/hydrogen exchanger [Cerioporus squamosus]|nr:Sodium/hydrogen exchanger [Cerioporus squamosus]
MPQALNYEEPSVIHLLVLASFLYLLKITGTASDYILHAGIVAEIAFGIIYGSPLTGLLPTSWESTFTALGYLGLVLVIFEGGLSTNLPILLSNLPLSIVCALTGIGLPIAFSFALLKAGFEYRPLEAFAAGAALSSTSLGTTLAALNSVTKSSNATEKMSSRTPDSARPSEDASIPLANTALGPDSGNSSTPTLPPEPFLQQSRIGTVLISAAIIDDVIGLVIASLIPALASIDPESNSGRSDLTWTIVRPLLSSTLIAVVGCLVARFILRPLFWCSGIGERWCAPARTGKPWGIFSLARVEDGWGTEPHADAVKLLLMVLTVSAMAAITNYTETSVLYGAYVAGLILTYISKPPGPTTSSGSSADASVREDLKFRERELSFEGSFARMIGPLQSYLLLPLFFASIGFAIPFLDLWQPTVLWRGIVYSVLMCLAKLAVGLPILFYPATMIQSRKDYMRTPSAWQQTTASIPPAVFMGVAMVSRGEIGLLIAQLARTGSDGGSSDPRASGLLGDEAFLVAIWAILLCTLIGPVSVGVVVRKWRPRVTAGTWA